MAKPVATPSNVDKSEVNMTKSERDKENRIMKLQNNHII